jgi:hypothetical protein
VSITDLAGLCLCAGQFLEEDFNGIEFNGITNSFMRGELNDMVGELNIANSCGIGINGIANSFCLRLSDLIEGGSAP